jgi:translocation and assembly module TamB
MTEPIQTPPAAPRKRRRFLRTVVILLVLVLVLVWFAPAIIARTTLRDKIVGMALKDFNGTLQSGGASMGWLSTVELHDVTMTEPSEAHDQQNSLATRGPA